MTEAQQIAVNFLRDNPKVKSIDLILCDLNGVVRGKRIERDLLEKVFTHGFYLPGSVMTLDATGSTVEEAGQGVDIGDKDFLCLPILETLSIVPWRDCRDRAQVLCSMYEHDLQPYFADTRQVLVSAVERFNELGLTAGLALELEFYLLDPARGNNGEIAPPFIPGSSNRTTSKQVYSLDDLDDYSSFIEDVLEAAKEQNIPADTVIAEYAPGQFEVNLNYVNDILNAVDHAFLLKRLISSVAKKRGMLASFMAKPYIEESGSGLHMHISLFDKDGNNIFASESSSGSKYLSQAAAGLLSLADASTAFFCPNINSYRRLTSGAFAPNTKTWGLDNRTVAVRVPAGPKASTRLEHRIAGADANPYLAVSCLLAGVTEGLKSSLKAPAPVIGNAYDRNHPKVPDNQRDALRLMQASSIINTWLGNDFVELYFKCKWRDVRLFENQVTSLEYELLLPYI